jgi:hypothetical protein
MIIAESAIERKAAKRKLRRQLKDVNIILKDICARSSFHYNTVVSAFDPGHKHWNQTLVDLAVEMIEEKKKDIEEKKNALLTK